MTSTPEAEPMPLPLEVWAARASLYLLFQGGTLLASYAWFGFDTPPERFPPGFRLAPLPALVHLAWGAAGSYIGFFRRRYALPFVFAFAAFYLTLALLGSIMDDRVGLPPGPGETLFHWLVGPVALAIGILGLARRNDPA